MCRNSRVTVAGGMQRYSFSAASAGIVINNEHSHPLLLPRSSATDGNLPPIKSSTLLESLSSTTSTKSDMKKTSSSSLSSRQQEGNVDSPRSRTVQIIDDCLLEIDLNDLLFEM